MRCIMFRLSWRRSLTSSGNVRRVERRRYRLALEVLEDRMAPAVLTVNSTADTAQNTDPYLSLREAIAIVNSSTLPSNLSAQILAQISGTLHAGHSDTIETGFVITLSGSRLELSLPSSTAVVTIDGGVGGGAVSGNNSSEVFQVDSGVQATFNNLNITGGSAGEGGAISNAGTLTVANCQFVGDHVSTSGGAAGQGGAISNTGTLTVTNCGFVGDHAD